MSDEALDKCRPANPGEQTEEVAAIQEALDDVANGDRGLLFGDFDREFRERHRLP
jgi:hypothetical protein